MGAEVRKEPSGSREPRVTALPGIRKEKRHTYGGRCTLHCCWEKEWEQLTGANSEQPESRTGLGGFQEKYVEKGKNWSQAQQKETSVRAVLRQRRSLLPTKMYLASR